MVHFPRLKCRIKSDYSITEKMNPVDPTASRLSTLADLLNRPLRIGDRTLPKRLVFAPMTFLGHAAFRELLSDFGGFGLLFSEMCSANTVPTENRLISKHFRWRDEELPYLACQIMGSEPERMAAAAARIEAEGFFGVDVNFGCSTASICRKSCGAAVLQKPQLAGKIIERIRRAVRIPVTVKFRTGWQDDPRLQSVWVGALRRPGPMPSRFIRASLRTAAPGLRNGNTSAGSNRSCAYRFLETECL